MKDCYCRSAFGWLHIVEESGALRRIEWVFEGTETDPDDALLKKAVQELNEYFDGRRQTFDLPLSMHGTSFQETVWKHLAEIPYGTTVTYRDLAIQTGNGRAVRAVGNAVGKNPFMIVIPCHRVIRSDGKSGGYVNGAACKKRLLALEKESMHEQ